MATDNPFVDDDDEDDLTPTPSENNNNKSFADLRRHAREVEKARKELAVQNEELLKFKSEVEAAARAAKIESTFKEVGLNEKHARLFEAVNVGADITTEAVAAFAAEYSLGGASAEGDEGTEPAPVQKEEGFRPVTTGTPAPVGEVTNDQVMEWIKQGNFDQVNEAYAKGRVAKEAVPWTVQS